MGREVRRVPAGWKHPKDENGRYIPLHRQGYEEAAKEFLERANTEGLEYAVEYFGCCPTREDYMPDWSESERTHLMMYENVSEGTPISPAFATPEELAHWLADTNASAFGRTGASYEGWLRVARGGFACSMVITNGVIESGVDALK